MEQVERIKVFIKFEKGKTVCICKRDNKRCNSDCSPDIVERSKFEGWESTMKRNKYGK